MSSFACDDGSADWEVFHEVEAIAESEKALLVKFDNGEFWVPKSMIDGDSSEVLGRGDKGAIAVRRWFVNKEGIE